MLLDDLIHKLTLLQAKAGNVPVCFQYYDDDDDQRTMLIEACVLEIVYASDKNDPTITVVVK